MSKVVVVKLSSDNSQNGCTQEQYMQMITNGLRALGGAGTASHAFRTFLPGGVIGMKTNCLTRKLNSTPVPLVDALATLLIQSGYKDNDIVVWERSNRELKSAGYSLNVSSVGRRCLGTDTNGIGYSDDFAVSGDVNSLVTRVLTDVVDFNINLPILKDHSIAGLSGGMKNMYGAIHNPNKFHDNNCSPYCAHVNNLEPIRTKNRLTILDAVRVQYNGGPGFVSRYRTGYNGIVLSNDPVAADRIGLSILDHVRQENGLPPLDKVGRQVKYLDAAQELGLGTADLSRINLTVLKIDQQGQPHETELFDG